MFSVQEKQKLAAIIESALLDLHHPEMPDENPTFMLRVEGKEGWSWAEIKPNWTFSEANPPGLNPWNEVAREAMGDK